MYHRRKVVTITAYLITTIILPLLSLRRDVTIIVVTVYGTIFLLGLLWYWIGGKIVLRNQNIKFISNNECPELQKEIQGIIKKCGLKVKIQLGVIDDALPNAFTIFLGPNNYLIVLSVGIFENLCREEILCVVAHEIAHIKNKDVFLKGFFLVERYWSFPTGALIEALVSRYREFRADEESVHLTGNPTALASALIKMTKCYLTHPNPKFKASSVGRSFLIIDPSPKSYKGRIRNLFSRHPTIDNRVKRLMELSSTI